MNKLLSALLSDHLRDVCFWLGLAFLGAGVAGIVSVSAGLACVGLALFTVAVFGIRATRGGS